MATSNRIKSLVKLLLKLGISSLGIYLVVKEIDLVEVMRILGRSNGWMLFIATALFTASKVVSSFRLTRFFQAAGLHISEKQNLKLYALGMFYNLFLPGGIGGDGYKVYWLNKQYKAKVKPLIGASLLDRISGMMALVFLVFIAFIAISEPHLPDFSSDPDLHPVFVHSTQLVYEVLGFLYAFKYWVLAAGIPLSYGLYYGLMKRLYKKFFTVFHITNWLSLAVQLLQVICIFFIMKALGIHSANTDYYFLFLISSVAAVLPISVGGLGIREFVFIAGALLLSPDENYAVALSFVFYLITVLISLSGTYYLIHSKKLQE